MKKLFTILFTLLVVLSCQKEEEVIDTENVAEVIFNAIQIDPGSEIKSSDSWLCPTDDEGNLLIPGAAKIVIDEFSDPFWAEVFYLDDKLYTQAIKLPVNSDAQEEYTVTYFGLYDQVGGTLIMASPNEGSHYSKYTLPNVDFKIYVNKFSKAEVPVQVLCFLPEHYEDFGFDWFQITEIVVREQCFFGDICVDDLSVYENSIYNSQLNGIQMDIPAIFYIDATKDGVTIPYSPFGNTSWFGEGAPLCVQYPDNISIDGEEFVFEMYVLVPDNTGNFYYQLYKTWEFEDDEMIPTGQDHTVDFVIGDCNLIPADVTFDLLDPADPPIDPVETCETAYAYGVDMATCFIDIPDLKGNRWGWTNGPLSEGSYTFDIYAAAGQCDLSKGTLVGTLSVIYNNGEATVTYNMDSGFNLDAVHLHAGNEILPIKNGELTTAPGQSEVVANNLYPSASYSYVFTGLSGDIYLVAHAVVCGYY